MCINIVRVPYVKNLSLICSDLLQRIFVCVALPCGWPACIAPAGSLAAGTLAVNDILIGVCRWLAPLWQGYLPYTHTHMHTHMHTHISITHFQPDSDGTILSTFSIWFWVTLWTSVCWRTLSDKNSVCKGICNAFPLWYPRYPWLSIPSVANLANYSR